MGRRIYSREELFEAWKKMEQDQKNSNEEANTREVTKTEVKVELVTKCCKNCANGFYRYVPPTGSFTEASEFAGCRLHAKVVNPDEYCSDFKD